MMSVDSTRRESNAAAQDICQPVPTQRYGMILLIGSVIGTYAEQLACSMYDVMIKRRLNWFGYVRRRKMGRVYKSMKHGTTRKMKHTGT